MKIETVAVHGGDQHDPGGDWAVNVEGILEVLEIEIDEDSRDGFTIIYKYTEYICVCTVYCVPLWWDMDSFPMPTVLAETFHHFPPGGGRSWRHLSAHHHGDQLCASQPRPGTRGLGGKHGAKRDSPRTPAKETRGRR